jgi:hypothetical protein
MDRPANLPAPLRWFFQRYLGSFWFRALIGAGLFFAGMLIFLNMSPKVPHDAPLALTGGLAVASLAWGVAMSAFLGWSMQRRRIRVLEAEVAALRPTPARER